MGHLLAHEEIHEKQQEEYGVQKWWDRYLIDKDFRLSQELEAYRAQYEFFTRSNKDRNIQYRFLVALAVDLASEMYGDIIKVYDAIERIKQ